MDYKEYLTLLFQRIPEYVYEGALSILLVGIVLAFSFLRVKKGLRVIANLLLIEYVFLIFCSTVIFRDIKESSLYKPLSFDTYNGLLEGGANVEPEIFFNVLFFVPIGILLYGVSKCFRWWHVMVIGCGISMSIETLQYIFKRGTLEVADIVLNTLGCTIGIIIVAIVKEIWLLRKRYWIN